MKLAPKFMALKISNTKKNVSADNRQQTTYNRKMVSREKEDSRIEPNTLNTDELKIT